MPMAIGVSAFTVLALWLVVTGHRYRRLTPALLLVFFFTLGAVNATYDRQSSSAQNLPQERREVSLLGILAQSPSIGPERTTLLMNVQTIIDAQGQSSVTQEQIQLSMAAPPPADLLPGDLFLARATVGPVPSYGVPGAFNYQEYLASQGISMSGWIRSPSLIMEIHRLPPPTWWQTIRYLPEQSRAFFSQVIRETLPNPQAGVYQAILLGEMTNLSPKVMEDFKANGSFHILSISGLHMALVSFCFVGLFSWLLRRSEWLLLHLPAAKVAALLSLIPLSLYALIAGFNPPVVRSLIMVSVFIFALLADRQWSLFNNIAIAAFLLLSVKPSLIATASFQLTFAAVIAIALCSPILAKIVTQKQPSAIPWPHRAWLGLQKWAVASLLVSLAATLGTAPILAYQFNRISLVSPLSTLLIEPFLCLWSLPLGLAAYLLAPWPAIAHGLLHLGGLGITIALALADLCARIPWSSLWLATPPIATIIAWYALQLLSISASKMSRRQLLVGVALCLIGGVIPLLPNHVDRGEAMISVLDVGQGSAIVIELANQEAILIDGGRKQSPSARGNDPGQELIAPFLWHKGITRLAMIVCSHPDDDHYSGIPFLLKHFRPKTLWVNGADSQERGYGAMLSLARQLEIAVKVAAKGTELVEAQETSLLVLHGEQPPLPGTRAGRIEGGEEETKAGGRGNNQSLVLRLTYGKTTFLLPSDIEKEGETELLQHQPLDLKADVLVSPHHGSDTSSSEVFLRAVSPDYVAISAGQNQAGHFPAPAVIERYQKLGLTTLNTAQQGSLFFLTNGRSITVSSYREGIRHRQNPGGDYSGI